jgi:hypothetical protein
MMLGNLRLLNKWVLFHSTALLLLILCSDSDTVFRDYRIPKNKEHGPRDLQPASPFEEPFRIKPRNILDNIQRYTRA